MQSLVKTVCARTAEAAGKAAAELWLSFLSNRSEGRQSFIFTRGEIFHPASRFYVGEVSAAGNRWLMHRQSTRAPAMLHRGI